MDCYNHYLNFVTRGKTIYQAMQKDPLSFPQTTMDTESQSHAE